MFRKKKKEKEQAQDIRLASQIDEEESFLSLMGRMARENKLAAASAILILVFILAAIFAPFLTRYSYSDMDLLHRLSLADVERKASETFGLKGRCVISEYASVGTDLDRPEEWAKAEKYMGKGTVSPEK